MVSPLSVFSLHLFINQYEKTLSKSGVTTNNIQIINSKRNTQSHCDWVFLQKGSNIAFRCCHADTESPIA